MTVVTPEILDKWAVEEMAALADSEYATQMKRLAPGSGEVLGVRVADLRELAREATRVHGPEPEDWSRYLSRVIPTHHRERILFGLYGLDHGSELLDDLFGERVGGWARELDNWELIDALATVVGWWVLADMSRVGYLEAWAVRGETPWKRRLAAIATITLNSEGNSYPSQTFRVLRNLMNVSDSSLVKAVGWALREVKDTDALLRYLAWWAPRTKKGLLKEALRHLDPAKQDEILALV
ncbi:DNA alkylation repair protein [bacterium]|nr:DNA alkylation repair protein [bacterium]